jgi:hypothetical protein
MDELELSSAAAANTPARNILKWPSSRTLGRISEVAVLAPIRKGRVPGERRTYEERLRMVISAIQMRAEQGIPNELDQIPTIHFGRLIIIRPEQYLTGAENLPWPDTTPTGTVGSSNVPDQIDDYEEYSPKGSSDGATQEPKAPDFRSWLLTLVEFDGDPKAYFREIAEFLGRDFDRVFQNCEHFKTTRNFEEFWLWIRRYQIPVDLFYARYPDLSVARIKQLQDFKRRFDAFVARVRTPTGPRVRSLEDLFDEFLRETQQYARDFPTPGGAYVSGSRPDSE